MLSLRLVGVGSGVGMQRQHRKVENGGEEKKNKKEMRSHHY